MIEVERTLNSEYGELRNLYMKELILKLKIYQNFAAFFNISEHQFTLARTHGPI